MTEEIDAGPLIGSWRNTNPGSGQIAGLRIERGDGRPTLNVWGVSRPADRDWGTVLIERLYRGNPEVALASAFEARYEFGPMSAQLEANLSKGLLIVACMKTFGDGSGRSDTFSRDFFRKPMRSRRARSSPSIAVLGLSPAMRTSPRSAP